MPTRPIPSVSLVLPDPGNSPIVSPTPLISYNAAKYSCTRLACGQFLGNEILTSNISLNIGQFYTANSAPGIIFQPTSLAPATSSIGREVNTTGYSTCNSACSNASLVFPTPPSSISVTPTPSITPTITVTPTRTPSVTVTPTPTATIGTSVSPSVTPTVTPTPTITLSTTPSVTPSVTVTPSQTPYSSPQFGIYVTCSFQILDTVPTCSFSSSNLSGSITGSLSSSVSTSGMFIPSSSFQTSMITFFPQAYTLYNDGGMITVPLPGTDGGSIGYQLSPDKLVVANNAVITASILTYYPEPQPSPPEGIYVPIVDFSPNCRLLLNYVVNKFGVNDISSFTVRTRVYKNTYLIFDTTRTHYNKSLSASPLYGGGVGYSEPFFYSVPYGTMCNNDDIRIVYSRA